MSCHLLICFSFFRIFLKRLDLWIKTWNRKNKAKIIWKESCVVLFIKKSLIETPDRKIRSECFNEKQYFLTSYLTFPKGVDNSRCVTIWRKHTFLKTWSRLGTLYKSELKMSEELSNYVLKKCRIFLSYIVFQEYFASFHCTQVVKIFQLLR